MDIKTFRTKQTLKLFEFFFSSFRVHHAVIGGNFPPIGTYASTVKNLRKIFKHSSKSAEIHDGTPLSFGCFILLPASVSESGFTFCLKYGDGVVVQGIYILGASADYVKYET
jgi:hypothetical protein